MTCDVSLFPDHYPDQQHRGHRATCCESLPPAPAGVIDRLWNLTHRLGHSRTPITVVGLAAVAAVTDRHAQAAIRAAERAAWLHRVLPEPYEADPPQRWIGSLPRR